MTPDPPAPGEHPDAASTPADGPAPAPGATPTPAADLLPQVYDELRALAGAYFRDERDSHTLHPTALVHEAYLRVVGERDRGWESRAQFFVIAATAMRHVLVDHARARGRQKRGGGWGRVTIQIAEAELGRTPGPEDELDVERLESALDQLQAMDERAARIVELRFFVGLDEKEAADVLGIARSTASEKWRFARAWLHRALRADDGDRATDGDATDDGTP